MQSLEPRLLFAGGPSIGDLDFSFGDHGRVWSIGDEHQFPANLLVQPDGSILVAAGSDQNLQVFRFAPGGESTGLGEAPFPVGVSARSLALQDDGKILVIGDSVSNDSPAQISFAIARFNADLTIDTSFGVNGIVTTPFPRQVIPYDLSIGPGGRIVVAGSTLDTNIDSPQHIAVAVYHANGSLDTSFDGDGKKLIDLGANATGSGSTFDRFLGVVITPAGKIVLAAESDLYDVASGAYGAHEVRAELLRLNANGTADTSFGAGASVNGTAYVVLPDTVQAYIGGFAQRDDGQYVFAANLNDDYAPDTWQLTLTRFTAEGAMALAPSNPVAVGASVGQILVRPDGNFYAGLCLLSPNGALLASPGGPDIGGFASALQPDGKILFLEEIQIVEGTEDFVKSFHYIRLSRYEGQSTAEHLFGPASYNDLAMDTAGRVYAAWYDTAAKSLKYAVRDKTGIWSDTQIIDADSPDVGKFVSIALDAQGMPSVAYQDSANADLKYAHFNGRRWVRQSIDTSGNTGLWTSLAFDRSGAPGISYYDKTHGDLRLAVARGKRWSLATIDAAGDVGRYSNLAIDPNTRRWAIAYEQSSTGQVRYARQRLRGTWEQNVAADTQSRAQYLSLAYDGNGHPAISYYDLHENSLALAGISRKEHWYSQPIAAGGGMFSNILFGSPDAEANFGFGAASEFIFYSSTDNRLNAAFAGDGELVDSIVNVRVSGNTGGTFATAVTRPYRKGHATGYNANALAWIDADGNLIVQGP
ncbi:MAG: exported protein of unknown function [Phycisphaerales bacterium]|nr:exported protein of unknown function [Phycisphaerales bacterium]